MQEKRKRILTMLENGTISMDEALLLLEQLQKDTEEEKKQKEDVQSAKKHTPAELVPYPKKQEEQKQSAEEDSSQTKKEASDLDDFLNEIRKDFTVAGERFMQFMQGAVQKVKEFDMDAPFGKATNFTHKITKPADQVKSIHVKVSNGNCTLHKAEGNDIQLHFDMKGYFQEDEEQSKQEIIDKILCILDDDTLQLTSEMKLAQVNVNIYVPEKEYETLSIRLTNGAFKLADIPFETIKVKTSNGKIDVVEAKSDEIDVETVNGTIYVNDVQAKKMKAETLNGRIYIDGHVEEVKAQSLNGNIAVTTRSEQAKEVEAKTMSGGVELYVPSNRSLQGELASMIGKLDVRLNDIEQLKEHEQFLQRSMRFEKRVEGDDKPLQVKVESKTGTIMLHYNFA